MTPHSAIIIALSLALIISEAKHQSRRDVVGPGHLELASALLLLLVQLAALFFSGAAPALAVGACLMLLGIALRATAMRALADGFVSDWSPRGELVIGGIYRWLRHPSEAGLLTFALGAAIASGSHLALLLTALLLLTILARLDREERALCQEFGARYTHYARAVPALLPRLPALPSRVLPSRVTRR
jgi:protein-S-isoprenylcysteine O-methyltransferase Ste14